MRTQINIEEFNYELPEERIAKFPLENRDFSKLLIYKNRESDKITETVFNKIDTIIPYDSLLVFNNTKVVRARMIFLKETGARIEIFCLEPHDPADYERAFAQKGECEWRCIVGNLKKWKEGDLRISFDHEGMRHIISATKVKSLENTHIIKFRWNVDMTFGQLLELLGKIPIPPYLNRDSQEIDNSRYQTVYSKYEGSVAAPTAGLHFTENVINSLHAHGISTDEVTLHVGAGTFLPVKSSDATKHTMHIEHFDIKLNTLKNIISKIDRVIAVGTTSVRTLESVAVLGYRVMKTGDATPEKPVGQWEAYDIPKEVTGEQMLRALAKYMEERGIETLKTATQIMITPTGFQFRAISALITNFHQPQSTLLLLISAIVGDNWKAIYNYAMEHEFRFLSYGDSSIIFL